MKWVEDPNITLRNVNWSTAEGRKEFPTNHICRAYVNGTDLVTREPIIWLARNLNDLQWYGVLFVDRADKVHGPFASLEEAKGCMLLINTVDGKGTHYE